MARVLCDVDGVLANFTEAYLQIVRQELDIRKTEADIDQWDIGDALQLTPEQRELVHRWLYAPGVARTLEPYEDALSKVPVLAQVCDLWFVTSPLENNPTWVYDRSLWFQKYFSRRVPGLPNEMIKSAGKPLHRKIIHTPSKSFIKGDVFIDDKRSNVDAWAKNFPDGVAFLWDLPHNQVAKKEAVTAYLPSRAGDHQLPRMTKNSYITNSWDVIIDCVTRF